MASVGLLLCSAVLTLSSGSPCGHYGDWGCRPRSHHVERPHHVARPHHVPVLEKRIHVTHEVHHIVHKRRRRPRPVVVHHQERHHPRPVVQVVEVEDTRPVYVEPRPEVVYVEPPVVPVVAAAPVQPYFHARAPPYAAVPSAYAPPYGAGTIDPRLVPVLRGSSPQQGDPLGIYPGGGLDPRIDPSLVPVARSQLEDQVRVLKTQLDVLTRRLGVPLASATRTAQDL